jgi:two-component system chemotaxis response regulator CheY
MSPSVLIVDGQRQTAEVIRDGLREMGLREINMVSDSERALRRAAEHEYALVIVDEHVAPLDGLALLRAMRQIRKNASTRYIFASAISDTATLLAAKAGGVSGFLLKPYSLASLQRTIHRVLGEPAAKAA